MDAMKFHTDILYNVCGSVSSFLYNNQFNKIQRWYDETTCDSSTL